MASSFWNFSTTELSRSVAKFHLAWNHLGPCKTIHALLPHKYPAPVDFVVFEEQLTAPV